MKFIDLTGKRFGRLVALERVAPYKPPYDPFRTISVWKCQCDCGAVVEVLGSNLRQGGTRSCGCLRRELARNRRRKA